MVFVDQQISPSYINSTKASFCAVSSDPGRRSPTFHASILKLVFAINAFHKLTTGRFSFAPSSTTASAYCLVVVAVRETELYPLSWSLGHQRCSLIGGGAIKMIRGLWATICGCVMIFSKLALYSSKGMCCLLGASGSEASLAPKKMV